MIGRESVCGITTILGSDKAAFETYIQVDSGEATRIEADVLRGLMADSVSLRTGSRAGWLR